MIPNGGGAVGPGNKVVGVLLASVWPPEYNEDVIQLARVGAISSEPSAIFETMEKLRKE